MKQATLQIKNHFQNINIMNNNIEIERYILNTMFFILAGLALFYVLILGNMVFSIIERKTLEKEMATLSNEVGRLEVSYLTVSSSVDMNLSSTMGFREIKASFATRKSLGFNSGSAHLGNIKQIINEI